jgi:hypothetical protein
MQFCQSPPLKPALAAICAEQRLHASKLAELHQIKYPAVPSLPNFIV